MDEGGFPTDRFSYNAFITKLGVPVQPDQQPARAFSPQ